MKTPDEIKKGMECCETVECEECPYAIILETRHEKIVLGCEETVTQDALAYIQQLEAQVPRWIGVDERMPEEDEDVLVYIHNYQNETFVDVGYYKSLSKKWACYASTAQDDITHWMPLPEPPEEVQHE